MDKAENKYKRIPATKALGIYLGTDEKNRPSMFVKLVRKPKLSYDGEHLIFDCTKRSDGLWALTVSITKLEYEGVFNQLVYDLADTVKVNTNQVIAERVFMQRFDEWKNLFNIKIENILGYSQIIGLVGELYFMYKYLFNKYGVSKSIKSWGGPIGADKDFQVDDIWYEVKSKSLNKATIHFNSQTQLFSENVGYLIVNSYEKSSLSNTSSLNLLDLYNLISDKIRSISLQKEFDIKLANLDFVPRDEYRDINVVFHNIDFYRVDETFPQVNVSEDSSAITNIEYDLYLPAVQSYREE